MPVVQKSHTSALNWDRRKYFTMGEKRHTIFKNAETVYKPEALIYMEHVKVFISNEAERIDC